MPGVVIRSSFQRTFALFTPKGYGRMWHATTTCHLLRPFRTLSYGSETGTFEKSNGPLLVLELESEGTVFWSICLFWLFGIPGIPSWLPTNTAANAHFTVNVTCFQYWWLFNSHSFRCVALQTDQAWTCLRWKIQTYRCQITTHLLMTPTTSIPQWICSSFGTAGVWCFVAFFDELLFPRGCDRWLFFVLTAPAFALAAASFAFAALALAIRASAIGCVDFRVFSRCTGNLTI